MRDAFAKIVGVKVFEVGDVIFCYFIFKLIVQDAFTKAAATYKRTVMQGEVSEGGGGSRLKDTSMHSVSQSWCASL